MTARTTRAGRCGHEKTTPYHWTGEHWQLARMEQFGVVYASGVCAIVCNACGEWLPLGDSNDAPEAVAIEIRAAELAECYGGETGDFTQTEWAGWNDDEQHSEGDFDIAGRQWLAGYLAFYIDMHHEPSLTSGAAESFTTESP